MKTVHNQIMILKSADFLLKRTPATLCWLKTASHLTKALSSCHAPFPRLLLIMVDYQDVFCLNGSLLPFLISPLLPDWSSIATSHCWANRYTIMVAISLNVTEIWKILYGKDTLERTLFPSFIKWRPRRAHTHTKGRARNHELIIVQEKCTQGLAVLPSDWVWAVWHASAVARHDLHTLRRQRWLLERRCT